MQLEGLGSAVDSPNRVWGGNRIWCILSLQRSPTRIITLKNIPLGIF